MNNWLKQKYFLDDNGKTDVIVDSLGDCILQSTYLIGRVMLNNPELFAAYLNETTLIFGKSESGDFADLHNIDNIHKKDLFLILGDDCSNGNWADMISGILFNGSAVLVHPIVERIPYSELYDPEYKKNERKSDHFFMIVGEDDENYYIVDNPGVVIKSKFTFYEKNSQIGIMSKELFERIADGCMEIYYVKFDEQVINDEICNWKTAYFNSYSNFQKIDEVKNGINYFYGRKSLEMLRGIFESEKYSLEDIAPSKDRDMLKYFLWKIWSIKGRRVLQKKYLEIKQVPDSEVLIEALDNNIKSWEMLRAEMIRNNMKGRLIIGQKYLPVIDRIISTEYEMHEQLGLFLFGNN